MVPHRELIFRLRSERLRLHADLNTKLLELGLIREDSHYVLERDGVIENWETQEVLMGSMYLRDVESEEIEDELESGAAHPWDEFRIEYLLATTPRECIERCAAVVRSLCDAFDLRLELDDKQVPADGLESMMNSMADELTEEYDEPGSEGVSILIEIERSTR